MEINVISNEFKDAIEKVERLLTKTLTTVPVVNSVLVKAEGNEITITAYNLLSALTVSVYGEIRTPGEIIIDKSNFKLIKKLTGNLNITEDDFVVTIKANRSLKFNSIDPSQFPELPKNINEQAFTISEKIFKSNLKIKAFVAKNHFRQVFNGVLFCKNDMVACNTHFLAKYTLDIDNKCEKDMVVPIQSINELDKILNSKKSSDIQFYYANKDDGTVSHLKIEGEGYTYITKLIEGNYPNYNQIIPQHSSTYISIEKDKLQDTIEFVKELTNKEECKPIVLDITNQLQIRTPEGEEKSMNEIMDSEVNGDELTICFNSEYMSIILKTITEDKINIEMSGKWSSAIFKGENNENELYILTPVRLKEDQVA